MPDILYGRNPVLEALRAGRRIRRLLLAPGLNSDQRLGGDHRPGQDGGSGPGGDAEESAQ